MSSTLFDETIRIAMRFANEIETRPWDGAGHILELSKQVGSLSACIMIREGYKPGKVSTRKIQDESSDVLFMLFRISHLMGISLSLPETDCGHPTDVESLMLTLVQGTGELGYICAISSDSRSQEQVQEKLCSLISTIAQVAAYYEFQLEYAHRKELVRASAWLDLQRTSVSLARPSTSSLVATRFFVFTTVGYCFSPKDMNVPLVTRYADEETSHMDKENLVAIRKALAFLVTNGVDIPEVLRNINQFAIALIPAEVCTTWLRAGDNIIVCKDTAYPLSRAQSVGGRVLEMKEGQGVGLTSHMAFQFAYNMKQDLIFNLSHKEIERHPAFGGGMLVNPYFPQSTNSLSMLCAPIIERTGNNFLGMVKIENRINIEGTTSENRFSKDEERIIQMYTVELGAYVLSSSVSDLDKLRDFI